ncbi:MAG: 4'-phosphopantetheinyl transferase superfamily protein [Bacteroidales bacterium]|nr:4'-phosphopantetheinyl transferase superfamily protein [Bacteroidales bacterium]
MIEFFVEKISDLKTVFGYDDTLSNKENISLLSKKLLIQKLTENGLSFDFHISREEKGKPFFTYNPNIHFSISNTTDYIAIIVSENRVGIDIEHLRKYNETLVKRFFNPKEIEYLGGIKPSEQDKAFTQLWTIKESYVKKTGTGISGNFIQNNLTPPFKSYTEELSYNTLFSHIHSFYLPTHQLFISIAE